MMKNVARAVYKFEFWRFTKETPNRWRPVEVR